MRKRFVILCFLLAVLTSLSAQGLAFLHEQDIVGTARYVGLAGTMTALGGDASAVALNPAGLGVYQRMELSATLDVATDILNTERTKRVTPALSQASFVFNIPTGRNAGVVSHNFMIGYQRLRTFSRSMNTAIVNEPVSLMDVAAIKTDGLYPADVAHANRWNAPLPGSEPAGWLSLLAYDTYMINPVVKAPKDTTNQWVTPLVEGETVNHYSSVYETGSVGEYSLAWAMNYNHRLYFGLSANMRSLYYRKTTSYTEEPAKGGRINNESTLNISGIGFNAAVGFIYRPLQFFRLGASLQTPSIASLTVSNHGRMESNLHPDGKTVDSATPYNTVRYTNFTQPLRFSAGVAAQLWRFALISAQYDLSYEKNMPMRHTLHAAAEVCVLDRVMLDVGYALQSDFMTEEKRDQWAYETYYLPYDSYRTDTDYRTLGATHNVGAGVGFRGTWGTIHVGYQYRLQPIWHYAHELASPYAAEATTHRVVLTVNWHTKN